MTLRQRYIEYYNYNINSYADLESLKEELKTLVDKKFSISVQLSAHGYDSSTFDPISPNNQRLESKPGVPPYYTSLFPVDYSYGSGATDQHSG